MYLQQQNVDPLFLFAFSSLQRASKVQPKAAGVLHGQRGLLLILVTTSG